MKIGILGGGQLGRMMAQEALNFPFDIHFLDPDAEAPCAAFTHFSQGDFKDKETVLNFAKDKDVIGIEIENVNVEALQEIAQSKLVIPSPETLYTIKDKGLQKEFYQKHNIPTADYILVEGKRETAALPLPFVQKLRVGGYDGKGVQIIREEKDRDKIWDEPSVIEQPINITKELSVMIATNTHEYRCYETVEMVFDPVLNLVDYLLCPADIDTSIEEQARSIALHAVSQFNSPGIFAVELFLDTQQHIWVNEIAPRAHNSGHLTIENCASSQFDNYIRILADYPLGDTTHKSPAAMINCIGEEGQSGTPFYEGLDKILNQKDIYFHNYGKALTQPGRKMGHVTVLASDREKLKEKVTFVKENLKVMAQ